VTASLSQAQEWFARTIMHAGPLEDVVGEFDAASYVSAGPRQSRLERLAVYHSAYRARLVECLADDYPAVQYALGYEAFVELGEAYVAAHPSRSPNLNAYGRHMPAFVLSRGGTSSEFLHDLAVLEWTIVETIHAAPSGAVDVESLSRVAAERWGDLRFEPNTTLRVLVSRYPVNRFFQAFREDRSPPIPVAEPTVTAVYRRGWAVWRMDVRPALRSLLDALLAGATLGDALAEVASEIDSEADVMHAFRDWVSAGFFTRIRLDA